MRDKLKRLLDLIPLIHANQGITMQELKNLAGYRRRKDLEESLEKLMLMGVPPFSPADFIEVYWDNEDRVYLEFPQGLERPLALTPAEWAAVQKALGREHDRREAGQKAREVSGLIARFSAVPVIDEDGGPSESKRALVEEALADRLQIQFQYRTLASPEPEIRRVDPWLLFVHRGVTYLVAHCYLREAPRHFHLERMEDLEILDVPQSTTAPDDLPELMKNSPIWSEKPKGFTVTLVFRPELRTVLEQYFSLTDVAPFAPEDAGSNREYFAGWLTAHCKVQESIWFRATLRSLGPGTLIVSPAHLAEAYRADLGRIEEPGVL